MPKKKEQKTEIQLSLAQIKEKYSVKFDRTYIPTGFKFIDHLIFGWGGIPVGSLIELYGQYGVGKSTLALTFTKSFLDYGGVVVYIDTENGFSEFRSVEIVGKDIYSDRFILIKEAFFEDIVLQMKEIILEIRQSTDKPILLIWDSLAGTEFKKQEETGIGYGARILAHSLRFLPSFLPKHKATLVIINHYRASPEGLYTYGGYALKYLSQLRLVMRPSEKYEKGIYVSICAEKNKFFVPLIEITEKMDYRKGFDIFYDWVFSLIALGIIEEKQGWYKLNEKSYRFNDEEFRKGVKEVIDKQWKDIVGDNVIEFSYTFAERLFR